jgi:hypothetical protein
MTPLCNIEETLGLVLGPGACAVGNPGFQVDERQVGRARRL